ncbi:MAG: hypothetical protein PSV35_01580 [bacterium]|nr:hypothetical protein [bacterium]
MKKTTLPAATKLFFFGLNPQAASFVPKAKTPAPQQRSSEQVPKSASHQNKSFDISMLEKWRHSPRPHRIIMAYFQIAFDPFVINKHATAADLWPNIEKVISELSREQLEIVVDGRNLLIECLSISCGLVDKNSTFFKMQQEQVFFALIKKYQEHEGLLEKIIMTPNHRHVYFICHVLATHNPSIFNYCLDYIVKHTLSAPQQLKQQLCSRSYPYQTPVVILALFASTAAENEEIYFKCLHEVDKALVNELISLDEYKSLLINPMLHNTSPLIHLLRFGNEVSLAHYFSCLHNAGVTPQELVTLLELSTDEGFSSFNAAISSGQLNNFTVFVRQLDIYVNHSLIDLQQIKKMILTPCARTHYSNFKYAVRSGNYELFSQFIKYIKLYLDASEMAILIHMKSSHEYKEQHPLTNHSVQIDDEVEQLKITYPECAKPQAFICY